MSPPPLEFHEHEAPLAHLIGRSPAEMDDATLSEFVAKLRLMRSSAQTRKAAVRNDSTTPAKKSAAIDFKKFL